MIILIPGQVPFVEFQNHVCFSMFLVILLLITALFIIVIPKGTGACGEFQILVFFNFFIPQIGEFQTHSISNPSTSDIFCFWKYPDYFNSAQRDGSLLRNSRFIF